MSAEKKKPRKPALHSEPLVPHEPDRTPANKPAPLIQKFVEAHHAFQRTFCKALQYAKEAGEALLRLQILTGLKGEALFVYVREQGEVSASNRSFFLYQRIGSRWNELNVVAGDDLSEMSLSQAVKLLQQAREEKPAKPEAQPETESASDVDAGTGISAESQTDAEPQDGQKADTEEPINVQPPFDHPEKDRLAAVFAQNGPAPTPLLLMTNMVIPALKKASEGAVSENDVPFLANAIQEAMALIGALKQKYAIN